MKNLHEYLLALQRSLDRLIALEIQHRNGTRKAILSREAWIFLKRALRVWWEARRG